MSLYFYSKDSSPVGVIGGIATNFILDSKKPLLSIVKKDDEITGISVAAKVVEKINIVLYYPGVAMIFDLKAGFTFSNDLSKIKKELESFI